MENPGEDNLDYGIIEVMKRKKESAEPLQNKPHQPTDKQPLNNQLPGLLYGPHQSQLNFQKREQKAFGKIGFG